MAIIALSASYGAGGSVIAPMVAERSDVPLLSRAVPAADSQRMNEEARESAYSEEELERGLWQRLLNALASAPSPVELGGVPDGGEHPDLVLRAEAEEQLSAFAAGGRGVVLGWAATLAVPGAYCVRLDGPPESRLLRGMEIEDIDEATARERLERTDEVRRLYWRRLYHRDWNDPSQYHLWLDTTVLRLDVCAGLIIDAAEGFEAGQEVD